MRHDTIQLAHGGGGRLMQELLDGVFLPAFGAGDRHDSAVVTTAGERVAFTTDSYVVEPRFFPGGDIGQLAVIGTVNDLAMAGATPRWLSAGFVLEEGLAIEELGRIVQSMRRAAETCGVSIVTGDTKVVDRGKGDGVFINTAGIGVVADGVEVVPKRVRPGHVVLVSGDVGRHGIAVLSAREGIGFRGDVASDCAPLHRLATDLVSAARVSCLRDLTRGGLASALNEVARAAQVDVAIAQTQVPVSDGVRGACELLGLDPLYVACEGRLVAFVAAEDAEAALAILKAHDSAAARIGVVAPCERTPRVTLEVPLGTRRVLDLLSGEQLPRIC